MATSQKGRKAERQKDRIKRAAFQLDLFRDKTHRTRMRMRDLAAKLDAILGAQE
jgi:hypothetical protein